MDPFYLLYIACFVLQLLIAGGAVGVLAYNKHRQKTNVHIMALNLVRGVPLTLKEKETMLDLLTPPPSQRAAPSWLKKWIGQWFFLDYYLNGNKGWTEIKNTVFYLVLARCSRVELKFSATVATLWLWLCIFGYYSFYSQLHMMCSTFLQQYIFVLQPRDWLVYLSNIVKADTVHSITRLINWFVSKGVVARQRFTLGLDVGLLPKLVLDELSLSCFFFSTLD